MLTSIEEMNAIRKKQTRITAASVYVMFTALAIMTAAVVMEKTGVIPVEMSFAVLVILLVIYNVLFVILKHCTLFPFERNSCVMHTVSSLNKEGFSKGYMWAIANNIRRMPSSPARDFLLILAAESHIYLGEFDKAYSALSGVSPNRSPELDLLYRSCFMTMHFETGNYADAAAVYNDIMTYCANADFRKSLSAYSDMYMSETKMLYISGNYNEYISRSESFVDALSELKAYGKVPMNTKQGIAIHRTDIAAVCIRLGLYDKAIYHLNLAIPDLSEIPYRLNKALALNNDAINAMKEANTDVHS